ncbi:AdeC/AdeK/OprM family multidrug efflux complex outer membrane factor [Stutzerimonas stutzeri]|uniref:AdeC/AdeK/OprM family multidrug efflux complex outer membrane factor n=1 Tax=Stutzerimonas stutzeri TaxID=316 RepID=UPI000D2228D4|nr:AdeC/AdeK/OprM family multidrug efflux complex outer membrane factor [Stutzerimonas stutzeri]AVX14925.1 AdeC/AdeK/OprM family multidrug efflux complex outer membrane factor [Stutzerimonas stutzeri]MCP3430336.1 AdeC/AdeK/OprM family multidrug efflux complex outer membrane factor [Stutzerimonas stutzeri]MDI9727576.1 AdeC/AdeK/OprM family multidrug efflux complex outer membrane factor [Stutzerimonas stutzeri]MDI9748643.1 AdeC/AdeK/OprM family multidrug efflux complex outer membrane factor [Stut
MNKSLLSLALMTALTGCSLIPDYQRPDAPVAGDWPQGEAYQQSAAQASEQTLGWREFFRDPALQQLIEVALENNRDLRVAALNVDAYRALYRIQRADLLPAVSADGAGTRSRTPGDLSMSGEPAISSQYSATFGVSWELDLFGRLRSLRDQALEEFFASEAAQRSTQISLIASVANAWLTLQADQALLQVTRDTLKTYEESFGLTQRSFDVGVASALELRQARSAVDSARVSIEQYTRLVAQDRNALTLLLGQNLPAGLPSGDGLERTQLAALPVGLPSDLLQQRPDILQAEFQLRAVNASIGAARAAFFPRISLTGAAGTASRELSGLFDGGSGYWSFSPSISVPIFNAGQLRANLDYAEISRNIQVAQYEKAIQTAFREVVDGLAAQATYTRQVQAQRDLLATSEDYYNLAERRYRTGVDSYLTVLDAQRQLFSVQQQLISDRLAQMTSEVNLFKALGGGWRGMPQAAPAEG